MQNTAGKQLNQARTLLILLAVLIMTILLSLAIGRYYVPVLDVIRVLMGYGVSEQAQQVVLQIRPPRIIVAVLVGGGLAVSGAAYQGMFKNPLVSPDLLGATNGAAFGAVLGIVLSLGLPMTKLISFIFGFFAVLLTWFLGTKIGKGGNTNFLLVLSGILISSLFASLINLMKYTADTENKLPEITFWLMGALNKARTADALSMLFPFLICVVIMVYVSGKINILALGEEEAKTLGVNTKALQIIIIVVATVLTSYSISITGAIGWVGLIVPHLARMLVGPNFRYLIPGSFLLGGTYLLLMDNLCRSLLVVEIPLGIATSLVGIPFFIFLMAKKGAEW